MKNLEEYRNYMDKIALPFRGGSVKPAFISGNWNPGNWNSYELIELRDVLEDLFYKNTPIIEELFIQESNDEVKSTVFYGSSVWANDTYYTTFTVIEIKGRKRKTTNYTIEIYKNRGRIERFLCNNEPISEEQFMLLLTYLNEIYPDKMSLD